MAKTSFVLLAILAGISLVDAASVKADPSGDAPPKEGESEQERPSMKEYKEKKAEEAAAKEEADADNSKKAAVNKVTSMLEDLQKQVIEEGEKEAETYDKFACFCKDMTKEKTRAIKKGQDEKAALSAEIERLQHEREDLDKRITELNEILEKAAKELATLEAENEEALALYHKNEADLDGAIYGLKEAIRVLAASKNPKAAAEDEEASLVQLQSVQETIKYAVELADALGLKSAKSAGAILLQEGQGPDVPMENYKFHSSGIIETLEHLLHDFESTKNEVDAEEVQRVQHFDMQKQEITDHIKASEKELKETKDAKDKTVSDLAEASQELTTVSATLFDDMEYLKELSKGCSERAQTWDQRSKMRVQELTAITEAKDIIKATVNDMTSSATIRFVQMPPSIRTPDVMVNDDQAMMAIEAEAEDSEAAAGAVGFLQRRMLNVAAKQHKAVAPDGEIAKQMIMTLLRNKGTQIKSTLLLSLATQIGADPFAKIKKLIQELIERLLQEAANEANQKGWCDKALADAKQKRDDAVDKVDDLNAEMAKLEARRDKLKEELETLTKDIAELEKAQDEASKTRSEEKAENAETIRDANLGLDATQMAIKILSRFYATAAKATITLSLTQGPMDDAPETSFKTGEAYTAVGSDSGGIVGMLEVIESDFKRTIEETAQAEKDAEQAHLEFMTESSKSLAEKKVAEEQNTKYLQETLERLAKDDEDLASETDIVVTSVKELMELQKTCIDTGMTYEERVAAREEEIAALKKASCILNAYAEYGPDGLADAC